VYISVGILETKRTNSRDNIKIYVKEIKLKAVEWIHLAQNWGERQTSVNTVTP